jgi:hypothetical protein
MKGYEYGHKAFIIIFFAVVINSVTWKASVFEKARKNWLITAKALAYCSTEFITAVKSFMIRGRGDFFNEYRRGGVAKRERERGRRGKFTS